ncbi:hypothetical protein [Roseovarius sp. A-2]|uniref:hypothetical protein n=1 Tax=Roseovarius sp. A-2 TaxID=1570360 RepID=UPI0009B52859|nr:hypothetical protein [Roseovarius sp. A-2]
MPREKPRRAPALADISTGPHIGPCAAGLAATAISFGPGRMGFGLFVPEFNATFAMSDTAVGLI